MTYRKVSLALVFVMALAAIIATLGTQSSIQGGGSSAPALEGSWNVRISFTTGPNAGSTGIGLMTYARGGGLVNSAPTAIPPVPLTITFSTGHGAWERTGGKEFAQTWVSNVYNNGLQVGFLEVRDAITLNRDGDAFDGRRSFRVFDLAGNPVPGPASCATLHGTRINVEPPDATCL